MTLDIYSLYYTFQITDWLCILLDCTILIKKCQEIQWGTKYILYCINENQVLHWTSGIDTFVNCVPSRNKISKDTNRSKGFHSKLKGTEHNLAEVCRSVTAFSQFVTYSRCIKIRLEKGLFLSQEPVVGLDIAHLSFLVRQSNLCMYYNITLFQAAPFCQCFWEKHICNVKSPRVDLRKQ